MDDAGFRRGELSRHARRLPVHPDPVFLVTDFVDRALLTDRCVDQLFWLSATIEVNRARGGS